MARSSERAAIVALAHQTRSSSVALAEGSRLASISSIAAFWDSSLADNEPFEKWEAAGSVDAATRANRAWKKALAEYEAPALDEGVRESLRDFVARRKAAEDDRWY